MGGRRKEQGKIGEALFFEVRNQSSRRRSQESYCMIEADNQEAKPREIIKRLS